MRTIKIQTGQGQFELAVTQALTSCVAKRNGLPDDAVTDTLLIRFFQEASNTAFQKAAAEYVDSDGTPT